MLRPDIEAYLHRFIPDRDAILAEMEHLAETRRFPIVGPVVGRILAQCAQLVGAERVLERGAEGVRPKLSTLDSTMEIPIFPLPNVVFFPRTLLPLHIFELRYRQMLADCLSGGRRLAVVLLRAGWEAGYYGRPAVYAVAGVGEIVASERLPDGHSNILLKGLGRIIIESEVPSPKPYRIALASWLDEIYPAGGEDALEPHVERLRHMCGQLLSTLPKPVPGLVELLTDRNPPSAFVDRVSSLVVNEVEARQRLLELADVQQRLAEVMSLVGRMLRRMERGIPGARARWN
jgi:Lon protease-like protein